MSTTSKVQTSKSVARRTSKQAEVAGLSSSAASVLFGGGGVDDFYEDLAAMRKIADQIIDNLPRLPRDFGMSRASVMFAHVTSEPSEGLPDFSMPAIPGLTGIVAVQEPMVEVVDAEVVA